MLQCVAVYRSAVSSSSLGSTGRIVILTCATHCKTLQNTATHCNTLQHTATHCKSTVVQSAAAVLASQAGSWFWHVQRPTGWSKATGTNSQKSARYWIYHTLLNLLYTIAIELTFKKKSCKRSHRMIQGHWHTLSKDNLPLDLQRKFSKSSDNSDCTQLVGSLKLHVSFTEYRLFSRALLQKRPIMLRSLLIIATP